MLNTPTLTLRTGPLSSTGRADPPRGSLAALSHMPEEVLALLVAEALQAVGALEVPLAFSCSSGVLALCRTLQPLGPSLRPPATGCCPLQSACFQVPGGLTPSMNPTGAWFSGVCRIPSKTESGGLRKLGTQDGWQEGCWGWQGPRTPPH